MDVLLYTLALIFSIFFIHKYLQKQEKKLKLPPSPPALPIIGHLHLIKTRRHRALQHISNKYGPLVYLRLGVRPTLVVSSPSIAEECFTKNDIIFANRPHSVFTKYLIDIYAYFSFSPYGDHWRNLRKVTTTKLFSSLNFNRFAPIWTEEIRSAAEKLLSDKSRKVNMHNLFSGMVLDLMMKIVAGKQWPNPSETAYLFSSDIPTGVADYIPIFRWIGSRGGAKIFDDFHRKMDKFMQDLIDESRGQDGGSFSAKQNSTFIQSLLSLQEAEPQYYTNEIIKGILMVSILPIFVCLIYSVF